MPRQPAALQRPPVQVELLAVAGGSPVLAGCLVEEPAEEPAEEQEPVAACFLAVLLAAEPAERPGWAP